MKEITCARIGSIITPNLRLILDALESGREVELIDRKRMLFMAACDLGPQWKEAARWPVIFVLEEQDV